MANQPRPWFRLASIRAVPAPAPAPQPREPPPPPPQPQPQPPRFTLDVRTSAPPSPSHKAPPSPSHKAPPPHSSSSSSPLPPPPPPAASPQQKATITASSSSPIRKAGTSSPSSPKTIKQAVESHVFPTSPTQSPQKIKTSVPPPSPLTLPPSSLNTKEPGNIPAEAEAEPKTVLVEMTVDKPRQWPNATGDSHRETGESRNNHASSRNGKLVAGKESVGSKEKGNHKKLSDSEDSGMRVITIAGENRGAYMELIQSQKKHEPNRNLGKMNGISKEKSDGGGESESSSSGEGNKNKNRGRGGSSSSFPMAAYMNSNVQCVNNSLLFNASCSHHDPGVRLSLSKKPFGEGYHLKERVEGHDV